MDQIRSPALIKSQSTRAFPENSASCGRFEFTTKTWTRNGKTMQLKHENSQFIEHFQDLRRSSQKLKIFADFVHQIGDLTGHVNSPNLASMIVVTTAFFFSDALGRCVSKRFQFTFHDLTWPAYTSLGFKIKILSLQTAWKKPQLGCEFLSLSLFVQG